ncbi:DUF4283 domain-containing protein [Raphanus sativus]|nr:DUF4283 domain-containing protein [Raphanus sativus]
MQYKWNTSGGASVSQLTSENTISSRFVDNQTIETTLPNFTIIPPKASSTSITNKALSVSNRSPDSAPLSVVPTTAQNPSHLPPENASTFQSSKTPSLLQRIQMSEDKPLKRLAPVKIFSTGRPRITIPDIVFQKGSSTRTS